MELKKLKGKSKFSWHTYIETIKTILHCVFITRDIRACAEFFMHDTDPLHCIAVCIMVLLVVTYVTFIQVQPILQWRSNEKSLLIWVIPYTSRILLIQDLSNPVSTNCILAQDSQLDWLYQTNGPSDFNIGHEHVFEQCINLLQND